VKDADLTWDSAKAPLILRRLFDAGVAACHPARVVAPALPARPEARVIVVGAGKAAAAMAAAVEEAWGPPLGGLVVTRYGHGVPTRFVEVVEAGHPFPDEAGARAARRLLETVRGLSADDLVLVLLSGGGSALTGVPLAPLTLAQKQAITRALVLSSASIREINCVRKHLSAIKGGRLAAAAHPARVLALAISDVPGDDPSVIASGPTVGDATTQAEARAILAKYGVVLPREAELVLSDAALESIKPDDPRLAASELKIIARGADALAAAADEAHALGLETRVIGVNVEGDARTVARAHAEIARHTQAGTRSLVLLSGGELTLTVSGKGRGGPNREYILALMQALEGRAGIWALAADSDGIDGSDDAAGAWIGPDTHAKARALKLDPRAFAANNDSGAFFAALGQAIVTGPTRTNVNDFRAILITPRV
jgi:hydroxypyruvate reductase